jgi:tetratricopeptide (TPR) repeat protein
MTPGKSLSGAVPHVGSTLGGRYRLDGEIGRGGIGVVFRGHDLELQRDVAVKVLGGAALDAGRHDFLLREARSAAALNHPNVITVHDVGEEDGVPYVVMELVLGKTLHELEAAPASPMDASRGIPRRASDKAHVDTHLEETLEIALQICEALAHAHDHGIVHRDLKPENVLLIREGKGWRAKLADLGLAVSARGMRRSQEGLVVGTLAYMAPEQALGHAVDGRADLYALGVMLYERATERLPFLGDTPIAVVSQHIHAPVVPPSTYSKGIPPALEAVILKLLAKDPNQRFASAADLAAALRDVLSGSVSAANAAVATAATAPQRQIRPASGLSELVRGRIVGRDTELETLRGIWRRARDGSGHLALISGEPGAGKTRLAREMAVQARLEGSVVLSGGCYEYEASTPYLPFVEAIRSWVKAADDASLRRITETTAPELARLAPELETRLGPFPSTPALPPHEERLRLFDHVSRFVRTLSRGQGAAVVLDDLHWADKGTLAMLHYLLRQLREDPVLFIGTYRETELDRARPLATSLVEWNRERLATRVQVRRLTRDGTRAMLAILLDQEEAPEELAGALHRETDGNPFFIEEVVKALIERGTIYRGPEGWTHRGVADLAIPQSVRAAIGQRLDRVAKSCIEILRTAAILGKVFSFKEFFAVAGRTEDEILDGLDEAVASQLLVTTSAENFSFTHDKIREVLYEEINPVRRRRLHLRVATGLEKLRSSGEIPSSDLAYHFIEGGDHETGLRHALAAAKEATAVWAHEEALDQYRSALECSRILGRTDEAVDVGCAMGDVCMESGEMLTAAHHYETALADAASDEKKLDIRCRIATAYSVVADPRGETAARALLRDLDPQRHPLLRGRIQTIAARYLHYEGRYSPAIKLYKEALPTFESGDDVRSLGLLLAYIAGAYQHLGDFRESNQWARRCIDLGHESEDLHTACLGHEFLSENAVVQGRWSFALENADKEIALAGKIQARERQAWSLFCRGLAEWGLGELDKAPATIKEGLRLAEQLEDWRLYVLNGGNLSLVLSDAGFDDECDLLLKEILDRSDRMNLPYMTAECRRCQAHILLAREDWEGVITLHGEWKEKLGDTEEGAQPILMLPAVCEAYLSSGREDEAEPLIEETIRRGEFSDAPWCTAWTKSLRGVLHASRGNLGAGLEDLDAAVRLLEETSARVHLGRALLRRSGVLRRAGRFEEASADLERARTLFSACGAKRDLARVDLA